jgi:hypothetical protein
MIVNEHGEWESESDPEEDHPRYDKNLKMMRMRSNPMKVIIIALFLFGFLLLL